MRNRSIVLAVATALGSASMGPAFAQETPAAAASASGVEEVVVTARRREESLQDVPIAVSALSGDQLRESQILAVKDVAAIAPGQIGRASCRERV